MSEYTGPYGQHPARSNSSPTWAVPDARGTRNAYRSLKARLTYFGCAMWNDETLARASEQIVGFARFIEWCGGWPWFHDAEVVSLELNRTGQSRLVVRVLGGPRPGFGPRANPKFSVPREEVKVTFILDEVEDLELSGFSHQNVISDLLLEQ